MTTKIGLAKLCRRPHPFRPTRKLSVAIGLLGLWIFSGAASSRAQVSNSVARVWDEAALAAIRIDTPHPPAQARNLFSLAVCMYDAWAAYDTNGAVGYVYHAKFAATDIAAARNEAISYAAYRMLKERHYYSKAATNSLAADDAQMAALGYDTNNISRDTSTPAGVGNSVYDAVSAWFIDDGARQTNGTPAAPYPDYPVGQGGYVYINPPLATAYEGITDGSGGTVVDINRWQRLEIDNAIDQHGYPTGPIQNYLGAQWLGVRPCALTRVDPTKPWIDFGPPPHLNGVGDADFRSNVVAMIQHSSQLTPDDGVTMDISPGSFGDNPLGTNDGAGRTNNPVTGLPYTPNVVKRGDFARVLAEFWADGPSSETPPGHWNLIANNVADSAGFIRRIGGVGPVVDNLEWDVKVYFAINAALHDAACAAWGAKRYYDGWRPLTAVRYLGGHGQSTDPGLPSYSTNGLPLITNLIELVTLQSVQSGRHAGLTPGKIAVYAWPGPPTNPATQYSGVRWIHADNWITYQKTNFVTPAFPGYISGHSTFSRAGAEILAAITGTPFFPGGMGTYTITNLAFEHGPSAPVQLQWATYFDASDQAGISRVWGGIHPPVDDFTGRRTGSLVGQAVWALARQYFDGSVLQSPITASLYQTSTGTNLLTCNSIRGMYYKLQSTTDLNLPFSDEPGGSTLSFDTSIVFTNTVTDPKRFYRISCSLTP